jgi:hypothetical protein
VQLVRRIAAGEADALAGGLLFRSQLSLPISADGLEALSGGGQTEKSGLLKVCETSRFSEQLS